ncbi:hypothetical protein BGW36DRAFT_348317 [Talaromyces proteolyticus]|uniref:Protein HRI1 n=1 Tax=Talaromyces proteolyticus TaxID=1131652 RepID=A0AAD4KH00_9EURO|nr:uncharacterized protein BGW36DRAFT_348317 [Talaromyces proteolyticus]KAH8692163.1 hypothetical protein BGW36DRAFT_348317 [Talaromyces proteolyticus]
MTVRVSTLISVQWPPEPVETPPDTLVISVGKYYVDLRIFSDTQTISWALAGQRIIVSEDPLRIKFTHCINSHHNGSDLGENRMETPDVGEFTKLPNGDDLEIGEMPASHRGGEVYPYREIWREIKLEQGGDTYGLPTAFVLESADDDPQELICENVTAKSFYARAGNFFLALRKKKPNIEDRENGISSGRGPVNFSAIRQEYNADINGWVTKYSIGNVENLFKMSDLAQSAVVENVEGDSSWELNSRVMMKGAYDGAIKETCIVRAVI